MSHISTAFRAPYDEALAMTVEARNYLRDVMIRERPLRSSEWRFRFTVESSRITARLTQVMAWLMMQRAVSEGEVPPQTAAEEANLLSGQDVCLEDGAIDDDSMPGGLRDLLARSHRLYQRVQRLEQGMLERLPLLDAGVTAYRPLHITS